MRITQIGAHHTGTPRAQKKRFPKTTPGQLQKRETHNRYFHLRNRGLRVEKGRAGVAWARPGARRQTRAGVPAASTRRCMRETRAAPPAALNPELGPPKRSCPPTVPGPLSGLAGAGGGIAEPQPPPPLAPAAPQGRPPARSAAACPAPPLADPPRLASGPGRPPRLLPRVQTERPAGQRSLPREERAVRRWLGVPRPREARAPRPRPLAAEPAPTLPAAPLRHAPRSPRAAGPSACVISPLGSSDIGGCPTSQFLPAGGRALRLPGAPSGQAAPLWTPLLSRTGCASAVAGGKFALLAARGAPPVSTSLPEPGARRRGAEPGPPVLSPSPAAPYPAAPTRRARAHPERQPRKASRRRGCILLLVRLFTAGWQARKAGAASPPHAASANFPTPPGQSGFGAPRAPAAALRLRSAPSPRPRAALLRIPPHPQRTRALALTSPERHMSSPALRNVPLQRRSGRGRQTLTKRTLASGRLCGGGGLGTRGWPGLG